MRTRAVRAPEFGHVRTLALQSHWIPESGQSIPLQVVDDRFPSGIILSPRENQLWAPVDRMKYRDVADGLLHLK